MPEDEKIDINNINLDDLTIVDKGGEAATQEIVAEPNATTETGENEENGESLSGEKGGEGAAEASIETGKEPVETNPLTWLNETTDGKVKTAEDLSWYIEDHERLTEKLKTPPQLEFPSEASKQAYEFAQKFEGMELDAMTDFLNLQKINVTELGEKEVLRQAFILDPKNKGLDTEGKNLLFDADYNARFGKLDETPDPEDEEFTPEQRRIMELRRTQEVNNAKDTLNGLKVEFDNALQSNKPVQVDTEDIERNVKRAMNSIDGISVTFNEEIGDGGIFNLAISDPQERSQIEKDLINPTEWFNRFLETHADEKSGDYNPESWDSYANQMIIMRDPIGYAQKVYDHAFEQGKLAHIEAGKNSSHSKAGGEESVSDTGEPKTKNDAIRKGLGLPYEKK